RERGELPLPYEPLEAKPPRVLFFVACFPGMRFPAYPAGENLLWLIRKVVDRIGFGWFNFRLILSGGSCG
ncbi:MAG: hypothetical protein EBT77_02420, partial [Verrucomicrobia bacterium]|nr:hypothetical protein [Verrucomicrobiota bacterium]